MISSGLLPQSTLPWSTGRRATRPAADVRGYQGVRVIQGRFQAVVTLPVEAKCRSVSHG